MSEPLEDRTWAQVRGRVRDIIHELFEVEVRFELTGTTMPGWSAVKLPNSSYFLHVESMDSILVKRVQRLVREVLDQDRVMGKLQDGLRSVSEQLNHLISSSDRLMRFDGSLDTKVCFDFLPSGTTCALFERQDKVLDTGIEAKLVTEAWDRLESTTFFRAPYGRGEYVGFRVGSFRLVAAVPHAREDLTWEVARLRLYWIDRLCRERQQNQLDDLTGLYSRRKFFMDTANTGEDCTLMLINPRHLKMVNNIYSQKVGDQLLSELARILTRIFSFDRCYRLYSGRFGVVFTNEAEAQAGAAQLLEYFEGTSVELISPVTHDVLKMRLSLQIAIATGCESVLDNATITLAHATEVDGDTVLYGDTIKSRVQEEAHWVDRLHFAMENDCVVAYFQGIHNNVSNEIDKYEALVRIEHEGTVYGPHAFMDVAMNHGFYPKITERMIQKSFETFATRNERVSVNLQLNDIIRPDFLAMVERCASESGMDLARVVFEFVETADLDEYLDVVAETVAKLHARGAKVAIDDFGTGYANFTYLQSLGVDILKIDGSLINNLDRSASDRAIVGCISRLALDLGIETIAEYVENEEIQKLVCDLGIKGSQGYLFCKPTKL